MKAKEYLEQVKKFDIMITNKLKEVGQWKLIAMSSTAHSDGERVNSSGSQQKMADAVCRYVTIQEEIDAAIDRMVDIKMDIIHTIERLPVIEYDILHKVYIQSKTLYEVAEDYEKTYSWATTIHGKALEHLQVILNERSCHD